MPWVQLTGYNALPHKKIKLMKCVHNRGRPHITSCGFVMAIIGIHQYEVISLV